MRWESRVNYQTDLKHKTKKKTVMIIDESDEILFRDLHLFHK